MRWLLENLGILLLSLVIAIVVWIAAEWEHDPIVEDLFDQPIPIEVRNQPPDTHIVEGWQRTVRVRLRAPQSVWDELSPDDFTAVLNLSPDLSPLEPGEYDIGVQVSLDVPSRDLLGIFEVEPAVLLDVEPEFVRIELETIQEREVPVSIEVRGQPDPGYYQAGNLTHIEMVNVRGPASRVSQVIEAVSNVSIQGARGTVDDEVTLAPLDAEGNRVTGVTLEPEQVPVSVPIRPLPNVKEMSVTWTQLGQPAEGYHITNVGIEPPVVRVRGPVDVVRELPGFLTTEPISIAGRTENVVERVPLELPQGISMIDPPEPAVQVTIAIEPFFDSVTVTRTLTFQGLRPGLMAVTSPEEVEVILSGPRPRLSALLPEEVRVFLDLSGLRLGDERQLEPVVVPPEGTTVESIIPAVIQVQVVAGPTPTP